MLIEDSLTTIAKYRISSCQFTLILKASHRHFKNICVNLLSVLSSFLLVVVAIAIIIIVAVITITKDSAGIYLCVLLRYLLLHHIKLLLWLNLLIEHGRCLEVLGVHTSK